MAQVTPYCQRPAKYALALVDDSDRVSHKAQNPKTASAYGAQRNGVRLKKMLSHARLLSALEAITHHACRANNRGSNCRIRIFESRGSLDERIRATRWCEDDACTGRDGFAARGRNAGCSCTRNQSSPRSERNSRTRGSAGDSHRRNSDRCVRQAGPGPAGRNPRAPSGRRKSSVWAQASRSPVSWLAQGKPRERQAARGDRRRGGNSSRSVVHRNLLLQFGTRRCNQGVKSSKP